MDLVVKAIVFDAVGTLIYPDPPVAAAYAAVGRRLGIEIAEEEVRARFRISLTQQDFVDRLQHGLRTGPEREQKRWREIVGEVFHETVPSAADREAIFVELWDHFARPESWRLYDDVESVWQSLTARGLIVAIASNFDDRLERIARHLAPLDRAHRLFISSRIGYRKPATEFYRFVERELGVEPSALLSVGDDWEDDYLGPKSAGWRTIFLNRDSNRRPSPDADVITSLGELVDCL